MQPKEITHLILAEEMLRNRDALHPRAAEVDEILGEDGFWENLRHYASTGEETNGMKVAKHKLFRRWYGVPLHSTLVEQSMSVMRRHGHRCLHAHLPHQRRHLRRSKNKTRLHPSMVCGVALGATFSGKKKHIQEYLAKTRIFGSSP